MKKKTNPIIVKAKSAYVPVQSDPLHHKFVWSYEITIKNEGDEIVQLLHRRWHITDMTGKVEEVNGVGVVGLQPIIKPGKEFVYTSYCQITTPQGTMEGTYEFQNLEEDKFDVNIPKFILSAPAGITKTFRSRLH